MLAVITNDIQKEMTKLCAKKTCSLLRQSSVTAISKCSWEALAEELERVSLMLYTILKGCGQCQTQAAKQPRNYPATKASIGHCHTRSLCEHPSAAQECSHEHLPAYHFTCLTKWAQCKAGIHIVYTYMHTSPQIIYVWFAELANINVCPLCPGV